MRRGFTLIELLVVITIVALISAAAIPIVVWSVQERSLVSSTQLLHGALVGARDAAIRDDSPHGIRLVPDSADPTHAARVVPLETGRPYSDGKLSILLPAQYPPGFVPPYPCLVVVQTSLIDPTNWSWNVRAGDKLRINGSRPYTVIGPMVVSPAAGNVDQFVTYGPPGSPTPFFVIVNGKPQYLDYLYLVNGLDDTAMYNPNIAGKNGYIDEGWDGVDSDFDGIIDNLNEWEIETWDGSLAAGLTGGSYILDRLPTPGKPIGNLMLASGVFVDLSQSALPVNPLTGAADIMIRADGTAGPILPYSAPTSIGLGQAKLVFWLADTHGDHRTITLWPKTGLIETGP